MPSKLKTTGMLGSLPLPGRPVVRTPGWIRTLYANPATGVRLCGTLGADAHGPGDEDEPMPLFRRDPRKKLQQAYDRKLEAAMQAMRRGDVRQNALLTAEAEEIKAQLDALER